MIHYSLLISVCYNHKLLMYCIWIPKFLPKQPKCINFKWIIFLLVRKLKIIGYKSRICKYVHTCPTFHATETSHTKCTSLIIIAYLIFPQIEIILNFSPSKPQIQIITQFNDSFTSSHQQVPQIRSPPRKSRNISLRVRQFSPASRSCRVNQAVPTTFFQLPLIVAAGRSWRRTPRRWPRPRSCWRCSGRCRRSGARAAPAAATRSALTRLCRRSCSLRRRPAPCLFDQ